MDLELLVDAVGVGFDGGLGHEQLVGDLRYGLLLGQKEQHIGLAARERVLHGNRGAGVSEVFQVAKGVHVSARGLCRSPAAPVVVVGGEENEGEGDDRREQHKADGQRLVRHQTGSQSPGDGGAVLDSAREGEHADRIRLDALEHIAQNREEERGEEHVGDIERRDGEP